MSVGFAAPDSLCLDSHGNFVDGCGKMVARPQQVGEVVKALEN